MKIKLLILCVITMCFPSCNNNRHHRNGNRNRETSADFYVSEKPISTFHIEKGVESPVRVVGITDGDTFKGLTTDNQKIKCRIYGIDAPEKKQAFGQKSKQYLSDLIFGKTVTIKVQGKSFDRVVVWCYFDDGKDISAEMIKAGMAWHFKKYSDEDEYAQLENKARQLKIGLWSDKTPIAPWEWRKK